MGAGGGDGKALASQSLLHPGPVLLGVALQLLWVRLRGLGPAPQPLGLFLGCGWVLWLCGKMGWSFYQGGGG